MCLRRNLIQTNELLATRIDKRYFRDTAVMMPFENFVQTFWWMFIENLTIIFQPTKIVWKFFSFVVRCICDYLYFEGEVCAVKILFPLNIFSPVTFISQICWIIWNFQWCKQILTSHFTFYIMVGSSSCACDSQFTSYIHIFQILTENENGSCEKYTIRCGKMGNRAKTIVMICENSR